MTFDNVNTINCITNGKTQLLGVPQMVSGTGENQAAAVYQLLQEWNLLDKVAGMGFDTTSCNTGSRSGTCILLEQRLHRTILNLACRHHIYELLLKEIFSVYTKSSGPEVNLFGQFQKQWNSIDKSIYQTGWEHDEIRHILQDCRENILEFSYAKLKENINRHDFRELLELVIIYLGRSVPSFHFRKPGAFHHARWIAKAIYCLKIWMLRNQLPQLTKEEEHLLFNVSIFTVLVYIKPWFTASDAASAPRTDLETLQLLRSYHDNQVGQIVGRKLGKHLWYLSEELVGLSLFDENVGTATKRAIVASITQEDYEADEDPPKRVQIFNTALPSLDTFASPKTLYLLEHLGINDSFLQEDPEYWENNESFQEGKRRIHNIPVVNDVAERGVALIKQFNSHHTTKDDQLQYLLGVVEQHRKKFPTASKAVLTTGQQ